MGDVLSKLKQVVKTAQEGVDDEFNDVMQMVRGGDPEMSDHARSELRKVFNKTRILEELENAIKKAEGEWT